MEQHILIDKYRIVRLEEEIKQLKDNMNKLVEFLNATNCHMGKNGSLIIKGYYNNY